MKEIFHSILKKYYQWKYWKQLAIMAIDKEDIFLPHEVMPFLESYNKKNVYKRYNNKKVCMNSRALSLFKRKGITCSICGKKARFFAIKRIHALYTFRLFGDLDGVVCMFNRDHVIPKKERIVVDDNIQVTCCRCNWKKDNKSKFSWRMML